MAETGSVVTKPRDESTINEHVLHDYIAGAVGGMAGIVVGHPFDTTKVQLQTQLHGDRYKGTMSAALHINKYGWVRGFYRGMSTPLLSYGIVNSVYFGVYGNTLKLLEENRETRKSSYLNIYMAGCAGGAAQLIPVIPTDYIKVVLQSQIPRHKGDADKKKRFRGPLDCARHIVREHGLRGLYKGGVAMAWRDVPTFGLYGLTYEVMSHWMKQSGWSDSQGIVADLVAGGCAGTLTWFLIIPFDVVKSRFQADFVGEFSGLMDCAMKSYREEGIRVFYRGCLVTCLRAFPVNAVTFLVYSQSMQYMESR
ncbi:solute carrier family 25 member 45-like [Crassostrea virginica]|uniref:Solute carrier family 25 member 45-like n=1 Tax=Crassostrea virginica TaxID=6565 RepID=A0A8B8DLW0_CRAVI|nr:solute carrier family 25 member 45-like [Crassostrea virginica]